MVRPETELVVNDASASGGLSKTRIEALTDGIFAIAMTLMVFDIKLPAPTQTTPWSLHYEQIRLWPRFLAYTISFIMLDVYWVHRRTDRGFLWINVFFLMGVSLLPFSTGLLGQYPAVRTALVVYGLNLIMVGGFLYALVVRDAQPPARRESLHPEVVRLAKYRIAMGPAVSTLAICVSLVGKRLSLAIFALIPLLYLIPGRIDYHWLGPRGRHSKKDLSNSDSSPPSLKGNVGVHVK